MTEHHRVIHRPAMIGGPLVQVAATNPHVGYFHQYILFTKGRIGDFP